MERDILSINKYIGLEKIKFIDKYDNPKDSIIDIIPVTDFIFLKTLWTGRFGQIILAKHQSTNETKTIKKINMKTVSERWHHVETETNTMAAMGTFPFTVKLESLAKDDKWVYLVMPLLSVGNLYEVIVERGSLNETTARFFSAQIILAIEFLHSSGLVYRNLKPENVLVNINGYVRLANFSMVKKIGRGRTYTLCGTPDYMAPELVSLKEYGLAVDYWSLGIILFEMVAGQPPFLASDIRTLFENIVVGKYTMSPSFSPPLQKLIRGMIQVDLSKRLGNLKNGIADIKNHLWFRAINWLQIINQKMDAPYKPDIIKFKTNNKEQTPHWKYEKEFFDF